MDSYKLIRLLREAGLEPMSYSGRFMYGARCVAVVTSNEASMVADLLVASMLTEDFQFIQELMKTVKRDDMAFDKILYWPELEWPNEISDLG